MKWLTTAWQLVRDVALTITGLWLIISQNESRDPSGTIIVAGLTLLAPAAITHGAAIISGPSSPSPEAGHGPPPSSPPASPPASSPSPGGHSEAAS